LRRLFLPATSTHLILVASAGKSSGHLAPTRHLPAEPTTRISRTARSCGARRLTTACRRRMAPRPTAHIEKGWQVACRAFLPGKIRPRYSWPNHGRQNNMGPRGTLLKNLFGVIAPYFYDCFEKRERAIVVPRAGQGIACQDYRVKLVPLSEVGANFFRRFRGHRNSERAIGQRKRRIGSTDARKNLHKHRGLFRDFRGAGEASPTAIGIRKAGGLLEQPRVNRR